MGLSDTRADHHLDVVSSVATTRRARASHVAADNHTGVPFPLPRWTAAAASVGASPPHGGLPPVRAGSASTSRTFEACSGFTRVTARRLARRTNVRLLSPRLQPRRLPTLAARIATELYRHLLGWDLHPLVLCALRGTPQRSALTRGRGASVPRPSGAALGWAAFEDSHHLQLCGPVYLAEIPVERAKRQVSRPSRKFDEQAIREPQCRSPPKRVKCRRHRLGLLEREVLVVQ